MVREPWCGNFCVAVSAEIQEKMCTEDGAAVCYGRGWCRLNATFRLITSRSCMSLMSE